MIKLTLFSLFLYSNLFLFSQTFEWVDVYDTSSDCYPNAVEVDDDDNVITAGIFFGTVDFDPGGDEFNMTSAGNSDVFVMKTNSAGDFLWAKSVGNFTTEEGASITIDSDGNIYITGYRYSAGTSIIDFDSGPGVTNVTFSGGWNMFVFKLDSDGEVLWAETIDENTSGHYARSIALDSEENVYITGRYIGDVDFDPGAGISEMSAGLTFNAFVLKLNPDGEFIWSITTAESELSELWSYGIFADQDGFIYTTGSFSAETDFDPGDDVFLLDAHESEFTEYEVFIQKLDTAGDFVWAKAFGGSGSEEGFDIGVNSDGDVYLAGSYRDTVDFDPDPDVDFLIPSVTDDDLFLIKLDVDGNFLWVNTYGVEADYVSPKVNLVGDNLVYLVGVFHGTVDFNESDLDTNELVSLGDADGFIAKYNALGEFISVNSIGSVTTDYIYDFYVDQNFLYLTGFFTSVVDFDFEDGVENRIPTSYSGFTAKYGLCTPTIDTVAIIVNTCDSYYWAASDETYFSSGYYTTGFPVDGEECDSTIALDLTINNSPDQIDTVIACNSYYWDETGYSYFTSSLISTTYTNILGCDSVLYLDVTILPNETNFIIVSSCESYTVPSGDETYTVSGDYMDTLNTYLGCDSVIYIDLTIRTAVEADIDISSCYSYTVPSGDETYTESGIYMDTLSTIYDCDSILTIDLTIHTSVETEQTVEMCGSYTVPSGDETYTESGIYTDTLLTSFGCDSIITFDLTINTIDNAITRDGLTLTSLTEDASSYQWLDCDDDYASIDGETNQNYTASENGNYAVIITKGSCLDTTDCFTINDVSIGENNLEDIISLFPNPTSKSFSIDLGREQKEIYIEVTDLFGQIIIRKEYQNTQIIQLELNKASGVYFVQIRVDENKPSIMRIIKQ